MESEKIQKLRNCPFCGGKAFADINENQHWEWTVYCCECFASTAYFATKKEATDAWERRVNN